MFILASQSPRRKELVTRYITRDFFISPSHYEEKLDIHLSPIENVMNLALQKGKDISQKYPHDTILSADTIVVLDNKIYGKPNSKEEAKEMLSSLSGKTHQVITAYAIITSDRLIHKYVISLVTFKKLSNEVIERYINETNPLDKAGSYGIQDP